MICKRGKGYGVRVHRGHGSWEWVGTYPTLKEARRREALALSTGERGRAPTVGEYAEEWLAAYAGRVKHSSWARARAAVNQLGRHPFARERIDEVPLAAADRFARERPSSVPTLITVFNNAIDRGAAARNPLRGRSRRSRGRRDLDPLTVDQVAKIADGALEAHRGPFAQTMRALILFAAYTGARPGEVYALEHADLELDAGRAMIRRRVHAGRVDLPKGNRPRKIALLPEALEALDALPIRGDGLVFRAKRGGRISEPLMSGNYWPPIRTAYGDQDLDLYELRHFCGHHLYVTLDLPSRVVAAQLGHSSPRLVEELYGHFKVGALDDIDRAVGRIPARLSVVRDAIETQDGRGSA